jgi:hypothetical protein
MHSTYDLEAEALYTEICVLSSSPSLQHAAMGALPPTALSTHRPLQFAQTTTAPNDSNWLGLRRQLVPLQALILG